MTTTTKTPAAATQAPTADTGGAATQAPTVNTSTVTKQEPDAIKKGPDLPDHKLDDKAGQQQEDSVTKLLREQAEARKKVEQDASDMKDEEAAQAKRAADLVKHVYDLPKDALKDATVEAVFGPIVDAETAHTYTTVPGPVLKDNGWLRMQINKGKIRIVN